MEIKKRINKISVHVSKQHVKQMILIALSVFLTAFIVIIGVYLVSVIKKVSPDFMTTDPLQTANFPCYTGLLSNLGVILWSISLGSSFLGAILLSNDSKIARFLIVTGIITAVLVIDDMFRLHDSFLRSRFHIPEFLSFFTYGFLIVIYLFSFYRIILSDVSFLLLAGALLFFGISIVFDMVTPYSSVEAFLKDSMKFIGIALWLTYNFVFVVRMSKQMRSG